MKTLVQWSIDHHWMVIVFSVLLLAGGLWTARDMPVDVFPDLTAPTVTILTEGRGMAPEEMESLVTFPIESAINGASNVRRVRSATALGVAVVWVEFDWGTDIFQARQVVAEKLALVGGTLPPQVERPVLAPVSSIMGEILFFAISSDTQDPLELRTVADTIVRRRLLAVAGRLAGHADRRCRAAIPGHRASGAAAREQRIADGTARGRQRRQSEHVGRCVHRGAAGVRAAGGRTRSASRRNRRDGRRHARRTIGADPRSRGCARGPRVQARRGIAQRQAGSHRRRAEAAWCEHHRTDGAARSGARSSAAGTAARDDDRSEDLPTSGLHRGRRRQRRQGPARRRHSCRRHRACCSSPICEPPRSRSPPCRCLWPRPFSSCARSARRSTP